MIQDIEFVCEGNNWRSPLAEVFARSCLKRSIPPKVFIGSSGVSVELYQSMSNEGVLSILKPHLGVLQEYGVITSEQAEELAAETNLPRNMELLKIGLKTHIQELKKKIFLKMGCISHADIYREPRQTVVRSQAGLILPVSPEVREKVLEIYSGCDVPPTIELLTTYAGMENDIPDYNFGPFEQNEQAARIIHEAARRSLERALS